MVKLRVTTSVHCVAPWLHFAPGLSQAADLSALTLHLSLRATANRYLIFSFIKKSFIALLLSFVLSIMVACPEFLIKVNRAPAIRL